MFRDSRKRLISAYHANLHSFGLTSSSRRRMIEHVKNSVVVVANYKNKNKNKNYNKGHYHDHPFTAFVNWPGIKGCQTKMVLGFDCATTMERVIKNMNIMIRNRNRDYRFSNSKLKLMSQRSFISDTRFHTVLMEEAKERVGRFAFVGLTDHWNRYYTVLTKSSTLFRFFFFFFF